MKRILAIMAACMGLALTPTMAAAEDGIALESPAWRAHRSMLSSASVAERLCRTSEIGVVHTGPLLFAEITYG